jgi:hypothetical protein
MEVPSVGPQFPLQNWEERMALRNSQNEPKLGTNSLMLLPATKSFKACFPPGDEQHIAVILVNLTVGL